MVKRFVGSLFNNLRIKSFSCKLISILLKVKIKILINFRYFVKFTVLERQCFSLKFLLLMTQYFHPEMGTKYNV